MKFHLVRRLAAAAVATTACAGMMLAAANPATAAVGDPTQSDARIPAAVDIGEAWENGELGDPLIAGGTGLLAVASHALGAITVFQARAASRPVFRVPFECGESWTGSAWSGHNPYYAVDFNHYPDDYGWKVTASAAGTVSSVRHLNYSYGIHVIINHGNGYSTLYAHLSSERVSVGQRVAAGQWIGRVGHSGTQAAHMHYEQRKNGNDVPVVFDGSRAVQYFSKVPYTVHCGSTPPLTEPPSNPYSIGKICGAGYRLIDSKTITGGRIVFAYSNSTGKNCVATIKTSSVGKKSPVSTFVQTKTKKVQDAGSYSYYAGAAKISAENTCVKWGGSIGSHSWSSGYEHCG